MFLCAWVTDQQENFQDFLIENSIMDLSSSISSSTKDEPQYEYRDRLRTWLVKKIDSGEIPGLHWLSDKKNIFRMPWKHAGRQDYNLDDDSMIFKVSTKILKHFSLS